MPVVQTSNAVSQDLLNAVNAKKVVAGDSVQADTDKFMTLLVTQLKNQDPLNPLDNAQITSQLAQLSTVTGVNKLNTTLESLKSSYQSSETLQAANMIGHGVLTNGDGITLSSSKAVLGVELTTPADSVQISIQNGAGKTVQVIDLGPQEAGVVPVGWDGGTIDPVTGAPAGLARDGKYSFKVVAMRGGEQLKDATALSFGTVASVSTNAKDGVKLTVPSVGILTMADIKQIM